MIEFLKQFSAEVPFTKIGKRYYLLTPDLEHVQEDIKRDAYAIGLPLGEEKREFMPSVALLEIIAKQSSRKAVVNKKAEWLFLCGRDILAEGVVSCSVDDGLVLVQNEKDENLGYGRIMRKGRQTIIKNLLDRGDFLRREH